MCWFWVYLSAFSLNKSLWKSLKQLYIWCNSWTILIPGPHCEASLITLFWSGKPGNARFFFPKIRNYVSQRGIHTNMPCIKCNLLTWIQNKTTYILYISQHLLFFYHSGSGNQTLSSSPTDSIEFWFFLNMCMNMERNKSFNHFLTQKLTHIGL